MLSSLYPYMTIIGVTSLVAVLYINYRVKKTLRVLMSLIKIKTQTDEDIKEYINLILEKLYEIDIKDLCYDLTYSYSTISQKKPFPNQELLIKKTINESFVKGFIAIQVKRNRGEQKILNSLILHIVTMQIVNKIHLKVDTQNESFKKMATLQTYMMHDLKNILQFFKAMQFNLQNLQNDEEKLRFVEYIKNSTEPTNAKVNALLELLKSHTTQKPSGVEKLTVSTIFEEYKKFYSLACTIEGDAIIEANKNQLQTIADNILNNIFDKTHSDKNITCHIFIQQDEKNITITITDSGEPFKNQDEVCEPFYTTKKGGFGVGMYQVATILEVMNASLTCQNHHQHPEIIITIPYNI